MGISRAEFVANYWTRKALVARGTGEFADLFSGAAVDELVARRGLRTPFLRVAKDGGTLPESSFTAPGGIGASIGDQLDDTALWRQFAGGATLVLQALHRTWEPITALSARLGEELGHPIQVNAYITPPQNRGFDDHYDIHDVFVLQIEGSKRWLVHEPVYADPLRDQPWTDHRAAIVEKASGEPVIDTTLEPGDVLYLPRGWLHAAQAQGAVSIHLTLGVHVWTRYAVAEQLAQAALARLRDDPVMRATLPSGLADVPEQLEEIRELLGAALAGADPGPALRRTRHAQVRPEPLGPLAQLAMLEGLGPSSPIRLRDSLDPSLSGNRLQTRVGWLDFADSDLPAIDRLLDGNVRIVADLGQELADRLLRAGVLLPG